MDEHRFFQHIEKAKYLPPVSKTPEKIISSPSSNTPARLKSVANSIPRASPSPKQNSLIKEENNTKNEEINQSDLAKKKLALRTMINKLKVSNIEQKSIDEKRDEIKNEIEKLKEEVSQWMKNADQKSVTYKHKKINYVEKCPSKRTKPSDVFQVIQDLKGEETLVKILDELAKLHTQHYGGKQHVKLVSVGKRKRESDQVDL